VEEAKKLPLISEVKELVNDLMDYEPTVKHFTLQNC